ncbi:hypothetical protein E4U55_005654, partial [Claviceps digitariae]
MRHAYLTSLGLAGSSQGEQVKDASDPIAKPMRNKPDELFVRQLRQSFLWLLQYVYPM